MESFAHILHPTPATLWMIVKVLLVFGGPLTIASLLTWGERRGAAMIQDRIGPNRAALFGRWPLLGLPQIVADGIKSFLKEDLVPPHTAGLLFWLAPMFAFIPAVMGFAVIPFGRSFTLGGADYHMSLLDPGNGMGMLYPMAIGAVAVYGILTAAWSSNNKWSILGGMRVSAQMVSYELAMGLAVTAVFMRTGGYDPHEIVAAQAGLWNVVPQFLGFIVFTSCMFAETNRLPFDFAEGESEIVAGYLTEYGSMKFALMYLSDYIHIVTASALVVTLYLGGWQVPFVAAPGTLLSVASFLGKLLFICWLFIWVRWTLPRFRYDQLMGLGWKVMLPLALANLMLHAWWMHRAVMG
ncbi:MAG TPA: NADH-quinone oxidoreductase subunit H [Holophaga sp.]|nr:NADH-quinone oxidoreductase subunit H [Holophaga sp.]HPS66293.1 NADH-quinone oxidoreductase subunit H [Holophaga sp.]